MNPAPSIPDHRLRRIIGRGAYGEVWLAHNIMGAPRAVKIIWRRQFESERPYEREFAGVQRYEPVSRSADGLVHVLHVGRNDAEGYFYYVMELADAVEAATAEEAVGQSWNVAPPANTDSLITDYSPRTLRSELQRFGHLSTADCLRLALEVVRGLAQLHRRGLVHRDVKPGNIIFVNNGAKLADIGLVTTEREGRTFVGTEGYIPPEGPGTPAADLYALGIALYEASTGFTPEKFPDVPKEWLADDAGDEALELHEVILKTCEGQRERRYQNAEAMQADLALLQSGQSVRRMRALERRVTWARRGGLAAGAVAILAVAGVLLVGSRARLAEQMRAKESALRARAETAEKDAEQKLHAAYLEQARATVLSDEMGRRFRTLDAVRRAASIRKTPELRREAFAALALPDLRVEREIDLGGRVNEVAMDAPFNRFAISRGAGAIEIWSLGVERLLHTLAAGTNLFAHVLRFSPDGRYLAFKRDHAGGSDSDLEVWNLVTTQRVVFSSHAVANNALSFHPSAPRLLAGRPSGRLVTWDLERGVEMASFRLPPHWCVSYSPDGERFAISRYNGDGGIIEVRDATAGSLLVSASFPGEALNVAWHRDGRQLAVPCIDDTVNLMDAQTGAIRSLGLHKAQAVRATFAPGGDFLVSGGWDNEINIWNLRSFQRELTASLGGIHFQFSGDGRRAALLADYRRLQIMDFSSGDECRELQGSLSLAPRRGMFSLDGKWFVTPTKIGAALWDVAGMSPVNAFTNGGLGCIAWTPVGDEIVGADETRLFRWRMFSGATSHDPPRMEPLPIFQPKKRVYSVHSLAGSHSLLFTGVEGLRLVALTNIGSGIGRSARHSLWVTAVSPDETRIAAPFYRNPVIRIFRVSDFAVERWLTNAAPVRALAYAPTGHHLAVLTDSALCLWDTTTWKISRVLLLAADGYAQVSYSADGRLLMLTENTRNSSLRDPATLELLLPFPVWRQPNAMSADGRYLAINAEGHRSQIWDLMAVRTRFRELGIDWE